MPNHDENPLRDLATTIAVHLTCLSGQTWTIGWMMSSHQQNIQCEALGLSCFIALTNKGTRLQISGHIKDSRYLHRGYAPECGCALHRGAAAIAADIHDKLIPTLLRQQMECGQTAAYWDGIKAQRTQAMNQLARLLEAKADNRDDRSQIYEYIRLPTGSCRTVVEMLSDTHTVSMELSNLSLSQAAFILELLQASRLPEPPPKQRQPR